MEPGVNLLPFHLGVDCHTLFIGVHHVLNLDVWVVHQLDVIRHVTGVGQGAFDAWNVELCSVRARVGRQCYRGWGKMLLLPSGVIDAMTLRKEEAFAVRKRVSVDGETRERAQLVCSC